MVFETTRLAVFGWASSSPGTAHFDVASVGQRALGEVSWDTIQRLAAPFAQVLSASFHIERERNPYFSHEGSTELPYAAPAVWQVTLSDYRIEGEVIRDPGPHLINTEDIELKVALASEWREDERFVLMADFHSRERAVRMAEALRAGGGPIESSRIDALACGLWRARVRYQVASLGGAQAIWTRYLLRHHDANAITNRWELHRVWKARNPPRPEPTPEDEPPAEDDPDARQLTLNMPGHEDPIVLRWREPQHRITFWYQGRRFVIFTSITRDHRGDHSVRETQDLYSIDGTQFLYDTSEKPAQFGPRASGPTRLASGARAPSEWVLKAGFYSPYHKRSISIEFDIEQMVVWYIEHTAITGD